MNNKTVLIIEDDDLNMKLVKTLLQIGKYRILEAKEAKTGIQMTREHHPDLILMDLQLPGMDGLEATRTIKKDTKIMNIPIVALTAHAMQGDEEKVMAAGCQGYIPKPIDTKSFLNNINQYI
jgi:CheY-like chemotaxis protein